MATAMRVEDLRNVIRVPDQKGRGLWFRVGMPGGEGQAAVANVNGGPEGRCQDTTKISLKQCRPSLAHCCRMFVAVLLYLLAHQIDIVSFRSNHRPLPNLCRMSVASCLRCSACPTQVRS